MLRELLRLEHQLNLVNATLLWVQIGLNLVLFDAYAFGKSRNQPVSGLSPFFTLS